MTEQAQFILVVKERDGSEYNVEYPTLKAAKSGQRYETSWEGTRTATIYQQVDTGENNEGFFTFLDNNEQQRAV
jgi:hypothetical protein